ncbi:hypothetical protein J3A84_09950 [Proteiniclasticum sp. SCR006]|uniref:Uncharacterized protein n=1 Tax=Proteiniclasticum aestuarii TaxID=2817862 RepID=A0A939H6U2_9CLOT|nr:hypothetical protein [Proteiniclasticum aestuarii]MBO1265352.1 hypothetical protein [Proteiniclasticum aestuarii]
MKVNGTDPLAKLLMELNKQSNETSAATEKVNVESLSKKVEEILAGRDEVHIKADTQLKPEVHFTRRLHETPEVYFQRISSEMMKTKEVDSNGNAMNNQALHLGTDLVEKAARAGLMKELIDQQKKEQTAASDTKENRWLLIFSAVFVLVLLIYLLFLS